MSTPGHTQYNAYSKATYTVAKTRQVVMLYDGAIRFLQQARLAIAEQRIEDRFNLLLRCTQILSGLQSSIDFAQGGEVAQVLHRFYTNLNMRIQAVNFSVNGQQDCDTLIEEIKQMRNAWDQIDRAANAEEKTTPVQPAPVDVLSARTEPVAFSA